MKRHSVILAATLSAIAAHAVAAEPALDEVTVLASRDAQPMLEVPASVTRIDGESYRHNAGVNLSEALASVPGLSAQTRGNYAQDLQLSLRGFGARSAFGARGIRLYADGIPATLPDGQGQYSHFDLAGAASVEVLRGPFSALYGNASGGVLSITTAEAAPGFGGNVSGEIGSNGLRRYALHAGDGAERSNWVVNLAHFATDGYRAHSAAARSTANAKWRVDVSDRTRLTLVANAIETPDIEDPLGLTAAQLKADPSQAGSNAVAYNTRKRLKQEQAGATLETTLNERWTTTLSAYVGQRHSTQYQAILKSVQALATHPGGVIDLDRRYRGAEWRVQTRQSIAGAPLTVTAGVTADGLDETRLGYLNFVGAELGVQGALRRNESNRVSNVDEYLQAQWFLSPRWQVSGGLRHTDLSIRSVAHLSGDALTTLRYGATNPVGAVLYRIRDDLTAYASYGRGFETPTLNDLAYRSTSGAVTGLNTALKPARSDNGEVGLKFARAGWKATLAGFDIRNENELAVKANSGGRSVYENIGPTRRKGAELALTAPIASTVSGTLAATVIDARTQADYRACAGIPCVAVTVPAGSRLPAVPKQTLYAGLAWHPVTALTLTAEAIGRSQMYADDRNLAPVAGYGTFNIRADWAEEYRWGRLSQTLRVDNLTDHRYVGSVIVNESNGRYYEPAAGRTALYLISVGLR